VAVAGVRSSAVHRWPEPLRLWLPFYGATMPFYGRKCWGLQTGDLM
jgi:hypothetical protein